MISTHEIIQDNISKTEFEDFCGNHTIDFNQMDSEKSDAFLAAIEKNITFSDIAAMFGGNLDQLAYCAAYAFSIGKLSRAAAASFLEYRSLKMYFPDVIITDIPQDISINSLSNLVPVHSDVKGDALYNRLTEMRAFETCVFTVKIPDADLENPRINGFLDLAAKLKIIKLVKKEILINTEDSKEYSLEIEEEIPPPVPDTPGTYVVIGSLPMRDLMTESRYGEHAKKAYPKLSKYSIEMIYASLKKYGRYLSVDFPGIPTAESFHKLKTCPFYVNLHDEAHRQFISTIPNPVYDAFLFAIEMVKEKTGIKWSREIWDAADMEVGVFMYVYDSILNYAKYDAVNIENNTSLFIRLLNANVFTENRTAGLFTSTPFNDTTWLLIIDMVINKEKWLKKGISLETVGKENNYRLMYDFVIDNKNKIENIKNPAEQVAIIKSAWFEIPLEYKNEIKFEREEKKEDKKNPRHIQVKVDGQFLVKNKNDILKKLETARQILSDFKFRKINQSDITNSNEFPNLMHIILFDPELFLGMREGVNTDFSNFAFAEYKDKIIDCHIKYAINSIGHLNVLKTKTHGEEIISRFFQNEKKVAELKWTEVSELYVFCKENPKYQDIIKKAFSDSHPWLIAIFLLADNNNLINTIGNYNTAYVMNAIQFLHEKKLASIDDSILNTLLEMIKIHSGIQRFMGGIAELDARQMLNPAEYSLLIEHHKYAWDLSWAIIKLNMLLADESTNSQPGFSLFAQPSDTTNRNLVAEKLRKFIYGDENIAFTSEELNLCMKDEKLKIIVKFMTLCCFRLPIERNSKLEL